MDTCNWDQERYEMIKDNLSKFLKEFCNFPNTKFIPIDGFGGQNISKPISVEQGLWYKGDNLLDTLDKLQCPKRNPEGPIRIPILDKMKDQGLFIFGKME